jgi:hypothetical protein
LSGTALQPRYTGCGLKERPPFGTISTHQNKQGVHINMDPEICNLRLTAERVMFIIRGQNDLRRFNTGPARLIMGHFVHRCVNGSNISETILESHETGGACGNNGVEEERV